MKKNKKTILFTLTLLAVNALAFVSFAQSFNRELTPKAVSRCYQTYGYCDAWNMGYKCTEEATAERCRRYKEGCKYCDGITPYDPQ